MMIIPAPVYADIASVTVTAPNGGEVWGGTQTITWTTTPPADPGTVNIYYCQGSNCGDGSYTLIAAAEANDGSYDWDTSTAGGDDDTYKVRVAATADLFIADNSNAVFTLDNTGPTVSDANISISGASGTGGAYRISDTVTATWDNSVAGDNNADVASVTMDFSQFGGGAAVVATEDSGIWTASYTILGTEGIDDVNRNVSVTATDSATNATTQADSTNATVDTIAPAITVTGLVTLTNDVNGDAAASIGDTLTYSIGTVNAGDGDTWTVDFTPYGLGVVSAGPHVMIAGDQDINPMTAQETVVDNAGNFDIGGATLAGFGKFDNVAPIITVPGTITLTNDVNGDGVASVGDDITYASGSVSVGDSDAWTVDLSAYGLSATAAPGVYTIIPGDDDAPFMATEIVKDNAFNSDTGSVSVVGFTEIDNIAPVIGIPGTLNLSNDVGGDGVASIGDVITYSPGTLNADDGDTWTVDLSVYGLSPVSAVGPHTVVANNDDGLLLAIETVTDDGGNTVSGPANKIGFTDIDNEAPSINTSGILSLSVDIGGDGIASIGDSILYVPGTLFIDDGDSWSLDLSAYGLGTVIPGPTLVVAGTSDETISANETVVDNANNSTTGPATIAGVFDIDNYAPVITNPGTVTLTNDLGGDGVASIGDTITYAAGTLLVDDGDSWTVDLSAYGLSAAATPGDYVVIADDDDAAFAATETVTDDAKNTTTGSVGTSGFTEIDNVAPIIVTFGTITLTDDLNGDGVAAVGDTITYAGGAPLPPLADGDTTTVDLSAYGLSSAATPGEYVIVADDDNLVPILATETMTDNGGNTTTMPAAVGLNIDNASPTFTAVGSSMHLLGDIITLTFNETMDDTTLSATSGITSITDSVGGALSLANDTGSWNILKTVYTITLNEETDRDYIRNGATVTVVLADTVTDIRGNSVSTAGVVSAPVVKEAAVPIITGVVGASVNAGGDTVTITSNEVLANTATTATNWTVQYDDNGAGLNIQTVTLANATAALDATGKILTITLDEITDAAYIPSSKYIKVTPGAAITDLVGNTGVLAVYSTAVTSESTAPTISAASPADGATGVAVNPTITVTLSEALNPTTVNNNTVKLYVDVGNNNAVNIGTDTEVASTVSLENNGAATKVYLTPNANLSNSGNYIYRVSTGVKDLSGNALAANADYDFTTVAAATGSLAVDSPYMINSTGTADNTYANGWEWVMRITLPTNQTNLALKFANWTSGSNTLAAANNMQYYSEQIAVGTGSSGSPVTITAANTYPSDITVSTDADSTRAGIQTDIHIKVKIPTSTEAGSYSTTYSARTQ